MLPLYLGPTLLMKPQASLFPFALCSLSLIYIFRQTGTKPKNVCDTVDCGRTACRYVSACVCWELLGVRPYSCSWMTRGPSPAFSAESLDLTLGSDRSLLLYGSECSMPWIGIALPRIGTCHVRGNLSHGTPYSTGSKILSRHSNITES